MYWRSDAVNSFLSVSCPELKKNLQGNFMHLLQVIAGCLSGVRTVGRTNNQCPTRRQQYGSSWQLVIDK